MSIVPSCAIPNLLLSETKKKISRDSWTFATMGKERFSNFFKRIIKSIGLMLNLAHIRAAAELSVRRFLRSWKKHQPHPPSPAPPWRLLIVAFEVIDCWFRGQRAWADEVAELGLQCPVSQLSARFTAPGLSAVSFLNAFRSHRRRNGGGGTRAPCPLESAKGGGGANSVVPSPLNEVPLLSFLKDEW